MKNNEKMEKDKQNQTPEVIDIEEFSKANKPIPPGKHYQIRVDNKRFVVDRQILTGREILVLAGKNPPERFQLNQKLRGGMVKRIALDEKIDLAAPGVERFMTVPLDQTEGKR